VILATDHWRSRFQAAHLQLLPPLSLDDSPSGNSPDVLPRREKKNALTCVRDRDVLGYIGPFNSPMTLVSEPILNRAGMVQISPGNTTPTLTTPGLRRLLEPATYHHRLAYPTYYRDVTTDVLQGPSDAAFMRERLHARTVFVVDDGAAYGSGLTQEVAAYGTKIGLRKIGTARITSGSTPAPANPSHLNAVADLITAEHPDAVYFGGVGPELDYLLRALRTKGYRRPVVGPDEIHSTFSIDIRRAASDNTYASDYGFDPAALPQSFRRAYRRRFHVPLQIYDGFAYDAANIALNGIYQAAIHGRLHGTLFQRRAAILSYVAHVRWHGATGVTTFDRNGDTTHPILNMYEVRHRNWVFIGLAPRVTGVSPAE